MCIVCNDQIQGVCHFRVCLLAGLRIHLYENGVVSSASEQSAGGHEARIVSERLVSVLVRLEEVC